jgi:hypothetical protein
MSQFTDIQASKQSKGEAEMWWSWHTLVTTLS